MNSESLKLTDTYSAQSATAPRVTLASMEAKIAEESYFTVGQALRALQNGRPVGPLDIMTLCVLVMDNGFVVLGKSAPASPENFDAEKGKRFAYEDAIKQLWPLEAYLLREKLSGE